MVAKQAGLFFGVILYLIIAYLVLVQINIPGLFLRKHYIKGSLSLFGSLAVTFAFSKFAKWLNVYDPSGVGSIIGATRIESTVWFLFFVILGYSFFNNMLKESAQLAHSREELESQRDKAELAMYKAQVNPHFLFNTLNTLYGLILTDSDKREEAFEKFVNMCKYTYNNANRDFISIEEEIEYLQEYVDLQKFRLGETTHVNTNYATDSNDYVIAPMLLVNFLENAFKYGISSTEECIINIELKVRKGILLLVVYNSHINTKVKASSHNGMKNVRHRLSLLYPDKYSLKNHQDKKGYTVKLMINLNK